jgi:hypothetical protein
MSRSYEVKFHRAEQHFNHACEVISDYVARKPYVIAKKEEPEALRRLWEITLTEAIPTDLAPTVGDCIHNLRAVLDNWVHEFSTSEAGKPTRDASFPILKNEADWNVGPCGSRKHSGAFRVRGLPQPVQTVIKSYQSFDTSFTVPAFQRSQLRTLHQLDIRDKHQALNVVAANMDVVGWGEPDGRVGSVRHRIFPGMLELHTPKPMLLIEFPNRAYFDMSVYPSADFQVVLVDEKPEGWPVPELVQVLGGFLNTVAYALRLLSVAHETGKSPFIPIPPGSE